VVVDAGEADVLVRQMPQLVDGGVYFDATGRDGIEESAEALLFDGAVSLWCAVHDSEAPPRDAVTRQARPSGSGLPPRGR